MLRRLVAPVSRRARSPRRRGQGDTDGIDELRVSDTAKSRTAAGRFQTAIWRSTFGTHLPEYLRVSTFSGLMAREGPRVRIRLPPPASLDGEREYALPRPAAVARVGPVFLGPIRRRHLGVERAAAVGRQRHQAAPLAHL